MTLTPMMKFAIISFATLISLASWIWVGVQTDALAVGLNTHVYNIVAIVIAGFMQLSTILLAFLGLKAPTLPPNQEE